MTEYVNMLSIIMVCANGIYMYALICLFFFANVVWFFVCVYYSNSNNSALWNVITYLYGEYEATIANASKFRALYDEMNQHNSHE